MTPRYFLLFLVLFTSLNDGAFIQCIHWLTTFIFLCDALPDVKEPEISFKERWNKIKKAQSEIAEASIQIYLLEQQLRKRLKQ